MIRYLNFILIVAFLFTGCKKNTSSNSQTNANDYYMTFKLGGVDYNVSDTLSTAYVYNDRSEGEINYFLNGIALYPSSGTGRFTQESQLMSLLNQNLPINTTYNNEATATAQVFVMEGSALYETPLATALQNDFPAHYLKITKITFLYSENNGYLFNYYKIEGEYNCVAGRTSPAGTKTLTGTFRVKMAIEII